jgi:hypothetical protein
MELDEGGPCVPGALDDLTPDIVGEFDVMLGLRYASWGFNAVESPLETTAAKRNATCSSLF